MKYLAYICIVIPIMLIMSLWLLFSGLVGKYLLYPLWHFRRYRLGDWKDLDEMLTDSNELRDLIYETSVERLIKLFKNFQPLP